MRFYRSVSVGILVAVAIVGALAGANGVVRIQPVQSSVPFWCVAGLNGCAVLVNLMAFRRGTFVPSSSARLAILVGLAAACASLICVAIFVEVFP